MTATLHAVRLLGQDLRQALLVTETILIRAVRNRSRTQNTRRVPKRRTFCRTDLCGPSYQSCHRIAGSRNHMLMGMSLLRIAATKARTAPIARTGSAMKRGYHLAIRR